MADLVSQLLMLIVLAFCLWLACRSALDRVDDRRASANRRLATHVDALQRQRRRS